VLACHDNRKASNLISNINPEDWKLMWKTLLIHNQPISPVNKVDLLRNFTKMARASGESLSEFISRLDNELADLKTQGIMIPDELAINVLQQGAGNEHQTFIRILIHQGSTFDNIKEELLTYEPGNALHTIDIHNSQEMPVANITKLNTNTNFRNNELSSQQYKLRKRFPNSNIKSKQFNKYISHRNFGKSNNNNLSSSNRSSYSSKDDVNTTNLRKVRCFYCKKLGHLKRDCKFYKNHMQASNIVHDDRHRIENISLNNRMDIEQIVVFSEFVDPDDHNNTIILDTGANKHLFKDLNLFNSIVYDYNNKNARVANGTNLRVYGKGEVALLKEVYYAPELVVNIISISYLDMIGLRGEIKNNRFIVIDDKGTLL